jgi:hypothetical protein
MLTYLDVQNSAVQRVAGYSPTSSDFADIVNEALRRLLRRGDWAGTVAPIQACVRRGCVVWPRYVGQIRKLNWCRRSWSCGGERIIPVENLWYRFIEPRGYRSEYGLRPCDAMASAEGRAPSYNTIFGDGRLVRAYPSTPEDIGKKLTLFGLDNGNQPLRTNNGDGTWSDGVTITIGSPFGSTAGYVRSFNRVRKDVTQGQVFLYAYNAADDTLEDLAIYDPGETNPSYVRQQLSFTATTCGCNNPESVIALAKLAFIPVKYPSDLVIIDNLEAIKGMVQSLKFREDNDYKSALEAETDAVRELNRQLEDESPDEQFAARQNPIGRRSYTNHCF